MNLVCIWTQHIMGILSQANFGKCLFEEKWNIESVIVKLTYETDFRLGAPAKLRRKRSHSTEKTRVAFVENSRKFNSECFEWYQSTLCFFKLLLLVVWLNCCQKYRSLSLMFPYKNRFFEVKSLRWFFISEDQENMIYTPLIGFIYKI